MPAKRGNRNAAGRRVQRERVKVALSLSEGNGLLPLFERFLSQAGEEATEERIREVASDWAYESWRERLEETLNERLSVQVTIASKDEGPVMMSEVAFGKEEAKDTEQKMIARLKGEGCTIICSRIAPDEPRW